VLSLSFDLSALNKAAHRLGRAMPDVERAIQVAMLSAGDTIIARIRADKKKFTHPTGRLDQSLWREAAHEPLKPGIKIGWGVPYGYVLERGPKTKKDWWIFPGKNLVATGKRAGLPTKMLRFVDLAKGSFYGLFKGKLRGRNRRIVEKGAPVIYAKKVHHIWTLKSLRPHMAVHARQVIEGPRQVLAVAVKALEQAL